MNPFSVCTYNLGSGVNDYFKLCKFLSPTLTFKSKEDDKKFYEAYKNTQVVTTDLLVGKASVFCLQEVYNEERPFIKKLKEQNFEIIYFNRLFLSNEG